MKTLPQWIVLLLCLSSLRIAAQAPGSGYSLDFGASNDHVSIPHDNALNTTNALTLEAWIKADSWSVNSWGNVIISKDGWGSGEGGYTLRCGANGTLSFNIGTTTSWKEVLSTPQMALNTWYHVAGTFDGTQLKLYINGVLSGTTNYTGTILTTTYDLVLGRITYTAGGTRNFDGKIDEVRIWSAAVSQAVLQEWMTKKLTPSHPDYASLMGYWKLDEGTGNAVADSGPGGFTGTRLGATVWGLSGAALGDDNAVVYGAPGTVTVANADGSAFSAQVMGGNPTGLHVYAVHQIPNTTNENMSGSLETTHYFGTFLVGGNSPTYTATLHYTGIPNLAGSSQEQDIRLAQRIDNSGPLWSRTTHQFGTDTSANSVLKCGIAGRREFAAGFDTVQYHVTQSSICQGDSLLFHGQYYSTPGFYTHTITTAGCDSTLGLQLSVTPTVYGSDAATICSGDSVVMGGQVLQATGIYSITLAAASGCDSIVTFSLTVNPPQTTSIADTICDGDSYQLGGQTLTQAGTYSETFSATNGCDSVVVLSLSIHTIDTSVQVSGNTLTANLVSPSYQWLLCDNNFAPIPGQTNQSFTAGANGSYAVIVSDGVCSDTSGCHYVLAIGLPQRGHDGIQVSPNPLRHHMRVQRMDGKPLGRVTVMGVDGRILWDMDLPTEATCTPVLDFLPAGLYLLRVKAQDREPEVWKLVKE